MKKYRIYVMLLIVCLLLTGCSDNVIDIPNIKAEDRGPDAEPTASYSWMAGQSPVPDKRIGIVRHGVNLIPHAVSPNGVYFIGNSRIYYMDNGTDTIVPLCGRVDCTHDNEDCNAYVFSVDFLSFYNGYLYALGNNESEEKCELIRMEPDGSGHVVVLDLLEFAKEHDGDFARCYYLMDGYCSFSTYHWVTDYDDGVAVQAHGESMDSYIFQLDGSMDEPELLTEPRAGMYFCGDTFLCYHTELQSGSIRKWLESGDLDQRSSNYLLEHPGITGYYDDTAGYYYKNGTIIRLDYATMEENILVETGLEGDYFLFMFPDCMVLASREENSDSNLYFYNWGYELVDTVKLDYSFSCATNFLLLSETAERFILTDANLSGALPKYYIDKAELGTGNVQIHEFKYA